MIHIDLFSGIGGFALAVDEVWPGSEHIFCEIDNYCTALLKKRFKGAMIYGDIRGLTREGYVADTNSRRLEGAKTERETGVNVVGENIRTLSRERLAADTNRNGLQEPGAELKASGDRQLSETSPDTEGRQSGQSQTGNGGQDISRGSEECFILTGGFPCQPFSQAGKRKGTDDNRYLWPEMLRVIRDFKPTWVIAENVRGILTIEQGMVFEQVCTDLEGEGYEVQPFIIPAVAVNAPHRRDRVWFVANRSVRRCGRGLSEQQSGDDEQQIHTAEEKQTRDDLRSETCRCCGGDTFNAPDTEQPRRTHRVSRQVEETGTRERGNGFEKFDRTEWERNWLEVAFETCSGNGGVYDGISERIHGFTPARHRVERLKALGNAIVPQVAVEIMRAIKNSEEVRHEA